MSKIVYGVSGQGSGHSSRAREMARHLIELGHEVRLVSYDRGYRNLKDDFQVFETEGLRIASEDNNVSIVKTFTENLTRLPKGNEKLQKLRQKLFRDFHPDCVVTDLEPMTAYLANHYDVPLITLDNQHRMRYMDYPCPEGLEVESGVTETIIRAMVPRPDVSLITTFFRGALRNKRTFLFPPILRREVLETQPQVGNHILVYVTAEFSSLLPLLKALTREMFLVYGYDRHGQEDNLHYRPFSKDGFLSDLANAKAVIGTAGFTLISEAFYLNKPYLALPLQGQFEQQLNAFQLEELGYGKRVEHLSPEHIGDFLYRLPDYEAALTTYQAGDNSEIKNSLSALVADGAQQAQVYHQRRNAQ